MSRENVDVVRRVFAAAARGDTASVLALYDPDVEWDASRTSRGVMAGRVARGRDGLLAWLKDWYEVWETIDDHLEELIEAGEDKVVSVMVQRGRGRASGLEVENRLGAVWTIHNGKIVRVLWFPTGEATREAVGLAKSPRSTARNDPNRRHRA